MVGFPGAGKTTVASYICELTGAIHIWADRERKKMFGQPTHSREESHQLYQHLNAVAGKHLAAGHSVVFDTNFNFRKDRQALRDIAARHGADTVVVWLTTPKQVAHKRATSESHGQQTRLFGNMHPTDFERMANNLEAPSDDEHPVKIVGTDLTKQVVQKALGL